MSMDGVDRTPSAVRVAPPLAPARSGWGKLCATLVAHAIAHPSLARDLLRVAWRFRSRRWYLRPPFLPLPDREYLRWRSYTAYGDENAVPPAEDVERYARWAGRGQ